MPASLSVFSIPPRPTNCVQASQLKNTLSRLKSGAPKEAVFQDEFYRSANQLLPTPHSIFPEFGLGSTGVDFSVNDKLNWLIEFFVADPAKGQKQLLEHYARFDSSDGRYKAMIWPDWRVVEFRNWPVDMAAENVPSPAPQRPNHLCVYLNEDYSKFVVVGKFIKNQTISLRGQQSI